MCPEQDSNLHASRHTHLKRARLPIPPPGHEIIKNALIIVLFNKLSGKRDSDPRPQPWQGCALPTELFPLFNPFVRSISLDCGCKGTTFFLTTKLFLCFFSKKVLIHAIFVVFVAKMTQNLHFSVLFLYSY